MGACAVFVAWQTFDLDRHHHIAKHTAPRQKHGGLKYDADAPVWPGDGLAFDANFTLARWQKAGDHLEEGGLAAAGRPDHDDELSFANREINRTQRRDFAVGCPIGFRDAPQFNDRSSLLFGLGRELEVACGHRNAYDPLPAGR